MSGVSLNGGLKKPLHDAVRLKLVLPWRPQDVGNSKAMRYLLRRAANREWNQPKREKCVAVKKAEMNWRSEEDFDIRLGDPEFGVCPVDF